MIARLDNGQKYLRGIALGWFGILITTLLLMILFTPIMIGAGMLALAGALGICAWRLFRTPSDQFYNRANFLAQLASVISIGFMVIAGFYFTASQKLEWEGWQWVYAAALMGVSASLLRWIQPAPPPVIATHDVTIIRKTRWIPFGLGVILLIITAEINGNVFDPSFLSRISSDVQFFLMVIGIIALAYGISGKRYTQALIELPNGTIHQQLAPAKLPRWRIDRREALMVALIVLFAFSLRVYQLGTAQRFWIDEVHFSNPVLHFDDSDRIELLIPFSSVAAFPYIFPYMQRKLVDIFGDNLVGLRMISALFGAGGVFALYLLARELFGVRVAWISAALLAAFPVHLQFSRIGLNNIVDPFLGTMTCYLIVYAWKNPTQARGSLAWAGVFLGLTQYFYEGGRFLFPALIAFWLIAMGVMVYLRVGQRLLQAVWRDDAIYIHHTLRADYRRFIQSVTIMIFVTVMVSFPIYYTLMARQASLGSRMETAGMGNRVTETFDDPLDLVEHILRRVNESFLIHVTIPEAQLYYAGDHPFLLPFMTPFFLLGGMVILWMALFGFLRRDDELDNIGAVLLVLWILLTWFGNSLLQESRISARYVVAFPAVILITALGIRWVLDSLWRNMPKSQNRLSIIIVVTLIVPQIWFYFVPQMARFNEQFRDDRGRHLDVDDALFRSIDFPTGTHLHIIDNPSWYATDVNNIMRFLSPDSLKFARTMLPRQFTNTYLDGILLDIDNAFFVAPDDLPSIRRILRYFPQIEGPFYTDFEASKKKGFALYYLPALVDQHMAG